MFHTEFGFIDFENKTYFKICKPQHFMIKFRGFGISEKELELMVESGVKYIFIRYVSKKTTLYKSHINQWLNSEKIHIFSQTDLQKFVSVKDMVII